MADRYGGLIKANSYDEYGIPGAYNDGRFQYTGQVWLPELGMYYYKARLYSPTLGRFLQTDPIGYGDGLNWYNYVGSDPVNRIDPTGLNDIIVTAPSWPDPFFYFDPGWAFYDLPSLGGVWAGGDISDVSGDGSEITVSAKRPSKNNSPPLHLEDINIGLCNGAGHFEEPLDFGDARVGGGHWP